MFGLHGQITSGQEETIKTNGGLMYYHYDGTRNVTELTNRHGEEIEHYRYDAFGNILTGITAPYNTISFTGHEYDKGSGLTYMNARWYDSQVGRFTSMDTYFGTLTNPQSQNLYAYVMNNPVNMWDPRGNVPSWVGQSSYDNSFWIGDFYFEETYTLVSYTPNPRRRLISTTDTGTAFVHKYKLTVDQTWKYDYHFDAYWEKYDEETQETYLEYIGDHDSTETFYDSYSDEYYVIESAQERAEDNQQIM